MTDLTLSVSTVTTPLVFASPFTGLWVDTLVSAGRTWRRVYSSSPFHHGDTILGATLAHGQLVAVVYAQAASASALEDVQADVDAAFSQIVFDLTVTETGKTPVVWHCDVSDVVWNEFDSGMSDAHLARATVTIPHHPVPS